MRLTKSLCQLPVSFDADRLRIEIGVLPSEAWSKDPEGAESEVVHLICAGSATIDSPGGATRSPTSYLGQLRYIKQVLASFGVAWSSAHIRKLGAGACTPAHVDVDCHWTTRVPLLLPIVTSSSVIVRCGEESANIQAGDAWVFDNWRSYSVENATAEDCVYLLAYTSGDKAFWELVAQGEAGTEWMIEHPYYHNYVAGDLLTEQVLRPCVMHPADLEKYITDLSHDIDAPVTEQHAAASAQLHVTLVGFCRDWRHTYAVHGDAAPGWKYFCGLIEKLRPVVRDLSAGLTMSTNGLGASKAIERLLELALGPEMAAPTIRSKPPRTAEVPAISRPAFIISAPRSGSTLLFETLATNPSVCTIGPDEIWLLENLLRVEPGASGIDSHRLDAEHATHPVKNWIIEQLLSNVRNSSGIPVAIHAGMRFLEKTPRNCLRVPFINQIFPDALFIYLWRDPRETISSMIEQWHPKGHVTLHKLHGFDRPWCFMLPPGWKAIRDRGVEEIAAYQWDCANRFALNDLLALPRERWTVVQYSDLLDDPQKTVTKLCKFLDFDLDRAFTVRLESPLPLSSTTASPPKRDKWRRHEAEIHRILPQVESTWRQLERITADAAERS